MASNRPVIHPHELGARFDLFRSPFALQLDVDMRALALEFNTIDDVGVAATFGFSYGTATDTLTY